MGWRADQREVQRETRSAVGAGVSPVWTGAAGMASL